MNLRTMDKNLILDHNQIDRDHQKLFDLIDQLAAAMKAGEGKEVCATLIDQLIGFARTHFAMEERLMGQQRYPQAAAHKAEHDGFVGKVVNLRQKIDSGSTVLSSEMLSVMRDWLNNHIQKNCKALIAGLSAT